MWGLRPLSKPAIQDNEVCVHYVMIAHGKAVGEAVGTCTYVRSNPTMSWGDAVEGCASDAITRIGKRLGMHTELWDHEWCRRWKLERAVQVHIEGKQGYSWRRKDREPLARERPPKHQESSEYAKPRDFKDDARDHLKAIEKE